MNIESANTLCRLCLEVVPVTYTIMQEKILNIIKIITSIEVCETDSLPKNSCSKCILNLCFVENVRNRILQSEEKLLSLYDRDGHFNELLGIKTTCEDSPRAEIDVAQDIDSNSKNVSPELLKESTNKHFMDVLDVPNEPGNLFTENEDISSKNIIYRKNDEKPYLYHCNVCDVDFYGQTLYAAHRGKHLKKTCNVCGVTMRYDYYSKHILIHKPGSQICDTCGSTHKTLDGLRNHIYHFHNPAKKDFICKECGKSFKYSHRLTHHKRKFHTGEKPHVCDSCGKSFFDLSVLKKHIKLVHLKLREYHCKHCKRDFTSSHALKVHTRLHTEEAPYVCDICSEGFRQKVSLKTHMKSKHDIVLSGGAPSTSQETSKEPVRDEYEQEGTTVANEIDSC